MNFKLSMLCNISNTIKVFLTAERVLKWTLARHVRRQDCFPHLWSWC